MGLCNRYCCVGPAGDDRVPRGGGKRAFGLAQAGSGWLADADAAVLRSDAISPVPVKWR